MLRHCGRLCQPASCSPFAAPAALCYADPPANLTTAMTQSTSNARQPTEFGGNHALEWHNPHVDTSCPVTLPGFAMGIGVARRAVGDIKAAIDAFRGASHAQLTELGEEQLSLTRKLVAALEADPAA